MNDKGWTWVIILWAVTIIGYGIIFFMEKLFRVLAYQVKLFFYRMDNFEWLVVGVLATIIIPTLAYIFYKMGVFDAIDDILGG